MQYDFAVIINDIDRNLIEHGAFHLAGDGALPDQFIESRFVFIEILRDAFRRAEDIGRADSFVRFLRVLDLRFVGAGSIGQIFAAEFVFNQLAGVGNRLAAEGYAVCSHIGNQTDCFAADIHTFIKALCGTHRLGRAEAEFARSFLLQR
jgi:hypothetical protein